MILTIVTTTKYFPDKKGLEEEKTSKKTTKSYVLVS